MPGFATQKDKKKVADSATGKASKPTYHRTSEDDWQNHQQGVSHESPNLYSVTNNPNEQALTGDGYSVTNGIVNDTYSGSFGDFFEPDMMDEPTPTEEKNMSVVDHGETGLVKQGGEKPTLDELVQEDPQGTSVKSFYGSIDAPNVYKEVSDKFLFTDSGPNQNDVRQYGIGDCYFWGAVLQILAHDSAKFPSMMKLNGKTVETTMYYKKGGKWLEEKVSRPVGIGGMNSQYSENNFEGYECGVRVDIDKPFEAAWNAVIDGGACMINRTDYYKAALWANCLEQAYSDFSRVHGKYGTGMKEKKDSGNEEFEGGCPDDCMHMFYGAAASNSSTISASNGFLGIGRARIINSLIEFKQTLNGDGGYSVLGARRTHGDPNTNSAHVYSIENVTFVDKSGAIVDYTDGQKHKQKDLDLSKSKLLLRNPWNSTDGTEGKFFEVSLEDFLNESEWTHMYRSSVSERTAEQ